MAETPPSDVPKPSATILFDLSAQERAIVDEIAVMSAPPKWPAFNALKHLNRAWKLCGIDEPMALFRCITAEEEAAVALFLSLKRRRYGGADRLKHENHAHKNAVIPFLQAVEHVLSLTKASHPDAELVFDPDARPGKLVLRFKMPAPGHPEGIWVYPQPPLHMQASRVAPDGTAEVEDFRRGVEEILRSSSVTSLLAFVRDRAELRNKLLYAKSNGLIEVTFDFDRMFGEYKRNVFRILKVYLLIDPYPKRQLFVEQALRGFLSALDALPKSDGGTA
jgi:hypothetical protein